jgi:hypothetical protein
MTPEQIQQWALNAGGYNGFTSPPTDWNAGDFVMSPEQIKAFANLVRNATLEEVAVKCEVYAMEANASSDATLYSMQYANAGAHCAEIIRSMKS